MLPLNRLINQERKDYEDLAPATSYVKELHYLLLLQLDPRSLNITNPGTKLTLMFNRVPKVGSQSTMALLRSLSYKNGFNFHKDKTQRKETIKMTTREQVRRILINQFINNVYKLFFLIVK